MSRYFIKIDEKLTIDLPDELDTQGRIDFCQSVVEAYPEYFEQTLAKYCSNNEIAEFKVKRQKF